MNLDATAPTNSEQPPALPSAQLLRWTGHVQGVGFRATVEAAARRQGIFGWVRNRSDGTVEALLIGSTATVAETISAVATSRARWLRSTQSRPIDPPPAWPPRFVIAATSIADAWPNP